MRKDECPPLDRAWTPAEGAAMVEEWRKSGMSASAFVRDRGFGLHRLKYWQSRSEKKADFVVKPCTRDRIRMALRRTLSRQAPPAPGGDF